MDTVTPLHLHLTHKKIQALEAKMSTDLAITSRLHNSRIVHEEKIKALEAWNAQLEDEADNRIETLQGQVDDLIRLVAQLMKDDKP